MIAIAGCTHDVENGFDGYHGPQPIGTIGTAPVGDDDGGDEDESSGDAESESDGGSNADEGGTAPASDGGSNADEGGTAPASDDGGEASGGVGETGTGDPVLDACLEIAVTECETCGCNLCLDPLYACQQDAGCVAMRDCAQMTGCVGTGCLEPCGAVIEMYGGPFGASGALALALSDCLEGSCPACF
ncbi:MAG TPA: hypothetical protein VG755_46170 [Nannocystaceae bacterium]|nr:hypothetical protein [Nannocystaceae bacterium]